MPSIHTDAPIVRRAMSDDRERAVALRHARILKLAREGLSNAEIAQDVQMSVKQVGRIVYRARPIPVPSWVPACMHEFYRDHGRRYGEQAAASECRKLKTQVVA